MAHDIYTKAWPYKGNTSLGELCSSNRITSLPHNLIPSPVVEATMRSFAGEGFEKRRPGHKRMTRRALVALGPNSEWSLDGHDKLWEAGFGIYGIRDKWSRFWLYYVVMPSNRYAAAVGVVFLRCVRKYGGLCRTFYLNNKVLICLWLHRYTRPNHQ